MKTIGFILIALGIIALLYSGFQYTTKEKIVEIGPLQIEKKKKHTLNWSPFAGIGILSIGLAFVALDKKIKL